MNSGSSLKRSISLPMLILYGLGTIIGAGIYVLIGEIAGHAGIYAPVAFLVAAIVAAFTGFTYGELAARLPYSGGEAVYVDVALHRKWLSALTGWGVVLTGIVSAAALVNGFSGYFQVLVEVPEWWIVIGLTVSLGAIAGWGIQQSAWVAAILTVISVAGLTWVLVFTFSAIEFSTIHFADLVPPFNLEIWSGILIGSFLAFYAFVGFEDMVNVAEEVHQPEQTIPRSIVIALGISTLLYALVAFAAVFSLPMGELQNSRAPLADVMAAHGNSSRNGIAILSMLSVVNGALVQVIMASRVLYGMARRNLAPARFDDINPKTQTPLLATGVSMLAVLVFALWLPVGTLAQITSLVVLLVFAVMHLVLLRLKRQEPQPAGIRTIPSAVPILGLTLTLGLILLRGLTILGAP